MAPEFQEETRTTLCSCVPFSYEQLREIVRGQQLKSVQEVLNVYGNRKGCEVCKPALSYMLDMLWCGEHEEDRSARFINDRVHANIQKDGTFSVVPRMRGGVTSPAELRRIADVAEKYNVPHGEGHRKPAHRSAGSEEGRSCRKVWADLGMPSGQAYTKGVRMVKTCVGTEFCRFGVQDSTRAGIELERRLENLFTPHKVKMGVVGCPRNCAEATVKDIGMVGPGRKLAGGGGRRGRQIRAQSRPADHRGDHRAGAGSLRAVLPVLPRKRQLPGAHLRFRRAAWDRERFAKKRCTRPKPTSRSCSTACNVRRLLRRTRGWSGETPVHPTQFVQIEPLENVNRHDFRKKLDSHYADENHSAAGRTVGQRRRRGTRDF